MAEHRPKHVGNEIVNKWKKVYGDTVLTIVGLVFTINMKYCFILFVPSSVCVWVMKCCVVKLVTHYHRPVKNRVLNLDCLPLVNYMYVTKTVSSRLAEMIMQNTCNVL